MSTHDYVPVQTQTLEEMQIYYRERAHEYDQWFYRQGRYDRGPEGNARWFAEADEVFAALAAFQLRGDVLELAPGTGIWTERLARTAATITAVDGSPEMLAINRAKVASERVTYVQADLFNWRSDRTYDAVVFCFWISHVPRERLAAFLASVAQMVRPGGTVFFVDGRRELTNEDIHSYLPNQQGQILKRTLNDGRDFQIVKNYFEPAELRELWAATNVDMTIHETATSFIFGYGIRR